MDLSALWHPRPFWKFLAASILVGLAIGIGFVLLIVPGILAMVFFIFSTVIVIDRDLGPIEAMKESMRIGRGYRWSLLGLVVLLALIVFVGMLALFVGLLVAMPRGDAGFHLCLPGAVRQWRAWAHPGGRKARGLVQTRRA